MVSRAEYQREWRKQNPGKAAEYSKRWKDKNYDKYLDCLSSWRDRNKEHRAEYGRKYTQQNLGRLVTLKRNKRAEYRNNEGYHTYQDVENLLKNQNYLCNECKNPLEKYDVDHIIPLSRGGSNWPTNLQILCPHCNRSKHTKTQEEWTIFKQMRISKNG